jgi:hypothetical protein
MNDNGRLLEILQKRQLKEFGKTGRAKNQLQIVLD